MPCRTFYLLQKLRSRGSRICLTSEDLSAACFQLCWSAEAGRGHWSWLSSFWHPRGSWSSWPMTDHLSYSAAVSSPVYRPAWLWSSLRCTSLNWPRLNIAEGSEFFPLARLCPGRCCALVCPTWSNGQTLPLLGQRWWLLTCSCWSSTCRNRLATCWAAAKLKEPSAVYRNCAAARRMSLPNCTRFRTWPPCFSWAVNSDGSICSNGRSCCQWSLPAVSCSSANSPESMAS